MADGDFGEFLEQTEPSEKLKLVLADCCVKRIVEEAAGVWIVCIKGVMEFASVVFCFLGSNFLNL